MDRFYRDKDGSTIPVPCRTCVHFRPENMLNNERECSHRNMPASHRHTTILAAFHLCDGQWPDPLLDSLSELNRLTPDEASDEVAVRQTRS